jgi:heptosyltransferase-2
LSEKPQRALIFKLGAIGDVVMAIPAVHQLHLQGTQIDWVCDLSIAPLLSAYSWIRPIVVDERSLLKSSTASRVSALLKLWLRLSGHRYHLCATLYYDPRYRLLALPVLAKKKIALSRKDRNLQLMDGRHHTDEYARILLGRKDEYMPSHLPPVPPSVLPASPLPRTTQASRIVLVPAGARNLVRDDALRRWPAGFYVALARMLLEQGHEVVLCGGPGDDWVVPHFDGLAVTNLIGLLSLPQQVALFREADVAVTHDTGPLHLAGLTQVGLVSIFGPTNPWGRLPARPNTVAIWGGEGFACRPCYDGNNYAPCPNNLCMQQVTPAMVLAEVEKVLQHRRGHVQAPPLVVLPQSTMPADYCKEEK